MTEPKLLKVFLCHASEDETAARELCQRLKAEGWIDPWLSEERLHIGEDWDLKIQKELDLADAVIVFISDTALHKEGYVQKELRLIYDLSLSKPEDTIFVVPLRLENCQPPYRFRLWHWGNYYGEEKENTYKDLLGSLTKRHKQKFGIEAKEPSSTVGSQPKEEHGDNGGHNVIIPGRQQKKKRDILGQDRSRSSYLLIGMLLVSLLVCGLVIYFIIVPLFPSHQVTPTPPANQSATASPLVTIPTIKATAVPPPTYFTEEWDAGSRNWTKVVEQNSDQGDVAQTQVYTSGGHLVFDLGKWLIAYMVYDPHEYQNVKIEVRAANRGARAISVVLVCRASEEGHYRVEIAENGLYAMYAYDGADWTVSKIADGGSTRVKPGEVNDYALVCNDRTLTLYINGLETRQYTDNIYLFWRGSVGAGMASEDKLPNRVEFDYVTISEP